MNKLPFLILLFLFSCSSSQTTTKDVIEEKVESKQSPPTDIQYEKEELGEMEDIKEKVPPKITVLETDFDPEPITPPMINFEDREVTFKPPMELKATQAGVVTIEICINKDGDVKSTSIVKEKTTITNNKMLDYFLERGKKYKFSSSAFAPEVHCGFLDFEVIEED